MIRSSSVGAAAAVVLGNWDSGPSPMLTARGRMAGLDGRGWEERHVEDDEVIVECDMDRGGTNASMTVLRKKAAAVMPRRVEEESIA